MGSYLFKEVVKSVMREAGYKDTPDNSFISEMKKNQFACNQCSSSNDKYEDQVCWVMIRANGDLAPALEAFKSLDDAKLEELCLKALKKFRFTVEAPAPRGP